MFVYAEIRLSHLCTEPEKPKNSKGMERATGVCRRCPDSMNRQNRFDLCKSAFGNGGRLSLCRQCSALPTLRGAAAQSWARSHDCVSACMQAHAEY